MMFIQRLRLQNYRCFADQTFTFDKPIVLIEGDNGSGKTTILEALHYSCFLKSFRTNKLRDLLMFDEKHLFLSVHFEEKGGGSNAVQMGISFEEYTPKKLIQFNQKSIKSYKELIHLYKIISLAEEDLQVVQGAPEVRRYFLNQLNVLFKPSFLAHLKKYRQILEQRNSIFMRPEHKTTQSIKNIEIWSKQLWEQSLTIQKERIEHLEQLETIVNELLSSHFAPLELSISFEYHRKQHIDEKSFEAFWTRYLPKQLENEWKLRRSLFGAHLDDFSIIFQKKKARQYASRGQQKLIIFLIKIALVRQLEESNMPVVLLLDDFLTDFDEQKLKRCISLFSQLSCQIFITCPLKSFIQRSYGKNQKKIQVITL